MTSLVDGLIQGCEKAVERLRVQEGRTNKALYDALDEVHKVARRTTRDGRIEHEDLIELLEKANIRTNTNAGTVYTSLIKYFFFRDDPQGDRDPGIRSRTSRYATVLAAADFLNVEPSEAIEEAGTIEAVRNLLPDRSSTSDGGGSGEENQTHLQRFRSEAAAKDMTLPADVLHPDPDLINSCLEQPVLVLAHMDDAGKLNFERILDDEEYRQRAQRLVKRFYGTSEEKRVKDALRPFDMLIKHLSAIGADTASTIKLAVTDETLSCSLFEHGSSAQCSVTMPTHDLLPEGDWWVTLGTLKKAIKFIRSEVLLEDAWTVEFAENVSGEGLAGWVCRSDDETIEDLDKRRSDSPMPDAATVKNGQIRIAVFKTAAPGDFKEHILHEPPQARWSLEADDLGLLIQRMKERPTEKWLIKSGEKFSFFDEQKATKIEVDIKDRRPVKEQQWTVERNKLKKLINTLRSLAGRDGHIDIACADEVLYLQADGPMGESTYTLQDA